MRPIWKKPMEQQLHTADVQALVGAMPLFQRRVKLRIACGDKGCGRVWERKVTMGDPQAQHAFEDTLREARLHCTLTDHAAGNLTVESL